MFGGQNSDAVSPSPNLRYPVGNCREDEGSKWVIEKIEELSNGPEKENKQKAYVWLTGGGHKSRQKEAALLRPSRQAGLRIPC